jgi:uncharacterized membrane protein YfcA
MDLLHILFLIGAGVGGGILAAIAGGAALVTFPALLAAGLSPVVATAVNITALTASQFLAALYDRSQLPPLDRSFAVMVLVSVAGSLIGAALLVITPERTFVLLVPLLLAFATVLFAFAGRIASWLAVRTAAADGKPRHSLAALLPVSIYGGYFGAGVGVLLLGVLSVGTRGHYRSANATKNLVVSLNAVAAMIIYTSQNIIVWPATLVLMAGTLAGALIGARIAQVMPNAAARSLIVGLGVALTAVFAWRYWF